MNKNNRTLPSGMISKGISKGPIGVFDSGYGGLTVLKELRRVMPGYDYLYLGDNARAPYGTRSFDVVYRFTLEAVRHLFDAGCPLVILACNTASAKALRTIQQRDLPTMDDPTRRVLGVIRPTAEIIGSLTSSGSVGIMGTPGTISSESYPVEVHKLFPDVKVYSQACPMWVPLVEALEADGDGADYFVEKYVDALLGQSSEIDTIVLACTHYPLLLPKIKKYLPDNINLVKQGHIIADSLADYLRRHPEMERRITRGGEAHFLTTERPEKFTELAEVFLDSSIEVSHIDQQA